MDCCSYVPNPVLVIIDVEPKELGIPTKAYYAVEEVKEVGLKYPFIFLENMHYCFFNIASCEYGKATILLYMV